VASSSAPPRQARATGKAKRAAPRRWHQTTTGLDQRRTSSLSSQPSGDEGFGQGIPIFIQTYDPSEERRARQIVKRSCSRLKQEGLRMIHLALLELVIQIL